MAGIDHCEPSIIRAFEKAGWQVVDQQIAIRVGLQKRFVYADLELKATQPTIHPTIFIAEVKCFPTNRSLLDEFYHAIGQYLIYESGLLLKESSEPLYLVVPLEAYHKSEVYTAIHLTLKRASIKIIVVDLIQEVIVQWINP